MACVEGEELNGWTGCRLRINEKDAIVNQSPESLERFVQDAYFLATCGRHSPNAWGAEALGIVNKLAIRRLECFPSTLSSHLHSLTSIGGRLPHLPISGTIRAEVDPPSI